uniref:non-specific serine/threonine protein kinase n=1 Tax=Oncorhynchus tshawytscha TaxID=74940 RepID=A0AAZ3R1B1_ONCTS
EVKQLQFQLLKSSELGRHSLLYVKEIGHGWFGKVLLGEVNAGLSTTQVVVKELKASASVQDQMHFLEEAQPYRALQNPALLQCLAQCSEVTPYLLVMEFCPLILRSFHSVTDPLTLQRMAEFGPLHLHKTTSFTGGDLALRNCLLTSERTVKIGDYGLSHSRYKDDYFVTPDQIWVPLRWIAPELIDEVHGNLLVVDQTKDSNVWSLGVTIWELFELGNQPYRHYTDRQVLTYAVKEQQLKLTRPRLKVPLAERWYEVMQFCWLQPEQRPNSEEVHLLLTYLCAKGASGVQEDFEQRWNSLRPNLTGTRPSIPGDVELEPASTSRNSFPLLEHFSHDSFHSDSGDDILTVTETSYGGLNFEYKWEQARAEQPYCSSSTRSGVGVVPVLSAHSPSVGSEYYIRIEEPVESGDSSGGKHSTHDSDNSPALSLTMEPLLRQTASTASPVELGRSHQYFSPNQRQAFYCEQSPIRETCCQSPEDTPIMSQLNLHHPMGRLETPLGVGSSHSQCLSSPSLGHCDPYLEASQGFSTTARRTVSPVEVMSGGVGERRLGMGLAHPEGVLLEPVGSLFEASRGLDSGLEMAGHSSISLVDISNCSYDDEDDDITDITSGILADYSLDYADEVGDDLSPAHHPDGRSLQNPVGTPDSVDTLDMLSLSLSVTTSLDSGYDTENNESPEFILKEGGGNGEFLLDCEGNQQQHPVLGGSHLARGGVSLGPRSDQMLKGLSDKNPFVDSAYFSDYDAENERSPQDEGSNFFSSPGDKKDFVGHTASKQRIRSARRDELQPQTGREDGYRELTDLTGNTNTNGVVVFDTTTGSSPSSAPEEEEKAGYSRHQNGPVGLLTSSPSLLSCSPSLQELCREVERRAPLTEGEESDDSESEEELRSYNLQEELSEEDSEGEVMGVPVVVSDSSGSRNLRSLLKMPKLLTQSFCDELDRKKKAVSFFDDVTVFLFDQVSHSATGPPAPPHHGPPPPPPHHGPPPPPPGRAPHASEDSDGNMSEEGGGFEWEDDIPLMTSPLSSPSTAEPPPVAVTAASQFSRFSVSRSRFSITHVPNPDMNSGGQSC